jgi:hypothetical protein
MQTGTKSAGHSTFKSALAYKQQIDVERRSALAELVAYDQELDI